MTEEREESDLRQREWYEDRTGKGGDGECFVCIVLPRLGLASVATLFAQEGATARECTCLVLDSLWPIGGSELVKQ